MAAASPDGVLLLDKPAGYSSTQALAKAKRLLECRKAGHTGTLYPFATGLQGGNFLFRAAVDVLRRIAPALFDPPQPFVERLLLLRHADAADIACHNRKSPRFRPSLLWRFGRIVARPRRDLP